MLDKYKSTVRVNCYDAAKILGVVEPRVALICQRESVLPDLDGLYSETEIFRLAQSRVDTMTVCEIMPLMGVSDQAVRKALRLNGVHPINPGKRPLLYRTSDVEQLIALGHRVPRPRIWNPALPQNRNRLPRSVIMNATLATRDLEVASARVMCESQLQYLKQHGGCLPEHTRWLTEQYEAKIRDIVARYRSLSL